MSVPRTGGDIIRHDPIMAFHTKVGARIQSHPNSPAGVAGDRTLAQCLGHPRVATARRLPNGVGLVFVAQPCEELELADLAAGAN